MQTEEVETEFDACLIKAGVSFLPWLGSRYGKAEWTKRRVLILGESHHYDPENGGKDYEKHPNDTTRDCVNGARRRDKVPTQFWKFIEQAVLNTARSDMEETGEHFWNGIAFYNFVQVFVGKGPRVRPTKQHFVTAHAPFQSVIDALRPDRILVCGRTLWASMPETPKELFISDELQGYYLADGKVCWCLATVHPCSGRYSWRKLHPKIREFLEKPNFLNTSASAN